MESEKSDNTREVPRLPAPRAWRLRFSFRDHARVRVLRLGESVTIGSGEAADVCLQDPTVSHCHCRVRATERGLEVLDLESKNGIYVGAAQVERALLSGPSASFSMGATSVDAEDRGRTSEVETGRRLLGDSEAMLRVRGAIGKFAMLRAPVLIVGESGTGKDVVAQALHEASGRSGRFMPLNVAALPDGLLDAELFGHVKGAFTGAVGSRAGLFEMASEGTLFLDEIADMSLSGQAKLLRVVEDGRVRCLGAEKHKIVDTRLISATCVPLGTRIEQGRFREDLYHRLSMLVLEIPPLRKRRSDIPQLANYFLRSIASELGEKHLLPASLDALQNAPWPGNVRQLFGTLYRAAALSPGDTLSPGHLALGPDVSKARPRLDAARAEELLGKYGNISAAARAAGVPRTTFRSVMERERLRAVR